MTLRRLTKWSILLALIVIMFGCATGVVRQQSRSFARAGTAYSEAMDELMQTTIDVVIENDSCTLLYLQKLTNLEDKKEERKKLESILKSHDKEIKKQLILLNDMYSQASRLKHYFLNLEELAVADVSSSAVQNIASLSDEINNANKKLKNIHQLSISAKEQQMLSVISGLVARAYQNKQLQDALKRDAEIISEQLLLHEKMLDSLGEIILHTQKLQAVQEYKNTVLRPYKKKTISSETDWKQVRKDVLLVEYQNATLMRAKDAAKQMRQIWHGIVENQNSEASIKTLLADLKNLAKVAKEIKAEINENKE